MLHTVNPNENNIGAACMRQPLKSATAGPYTMCMFVIVLCCVFHGLNLRRERSDGPEHCMQLIETRPPGRIHL